MPYVQGGVAMLAKEIPKRIIVPASLRPVGEINVVVAFIVGADGKISGKRILRAMKGSDIAEQLLVLVDDLTWEPGECYGKQ